MALYERFPHLSCVGCRWGPPRVRRSDCQREEQEASCDVHGDVVSTKQGLHTDALHLELVEIDTPHTETRTEVSGVYNRLGGWCATRVVTGWLVVRCPHDPRIR